MHYSDWNRFTPPYPHTHDGVGFVESYSALLPLKPTPLDLHDCCNGLLLFGPSPSVRPAEYYVCNPATKQCVAIPTNPTHLEPMFAALAFNPTESLNYKIVRFAQTALSASISNPLKLDIFSSDTGKWVTHVVPLDPAVYGLKWIKHCVYFNGVLYMLSWASYLIAFDINIKTGGNISGRAIELPEKGRFDYRGSIGISKDCFYYSNHDGSEWCIWSLDHGEKWNLRHKIPFQHFAVARHPVGKLLYQNRLGTRPCGFHPTSEIIFIATPKFGAF
ncbi:uncharacterized protein LOC132309684 [Cornus florida]|uniref:uncharacterized protein LOC132309684 n=1 Tax=Cornus florida TaxID=4283 RepID=UPI0028984F7B|nr:uncharacterized protein LOC132309684 [Cornus florida]